MTRAAHERSDEMDATMYRHIKPPTMGERISVRVPIKFEGIPVGVRSNGGLLEEVMHELEVEVDPTNIPEMFVVDVVSLTIGHSIHARDIALPAGVTLLTDADATICLVSAPRAAVEAAADAPASTEPEVIRKAKADEAAEK